jgi:predicted nucleic acid-binding protein
LLSAVAKRAASRILRDRPELRIVTTIVTIGEVRWHVAEFAERYQIDMGEMHKTIDSFPIRRYRYNEYRSHMAAARRYLALRDPSDVGLAALALKLNMPIWTNDNDFRELPLPIYTTAQLLRALGM